MPFIIPSIKCTRTNAWAALAVCVTSLLLGGCKSDQGAAPDEKPGDTARAAAANIDKQIEKVKNDPNVPPEAKQRAIEGMERGKAAAAAAAANAAGAKPPGGAKP